MGKFVTREIRVLSDEKVDIDEKDTLASRIFGLFLVICLTGGATAVLMQVLRM